MVDKTIKNWIIGLIIIFISCFIGLFIFMCLFSVYEFNQKKENQSMVNTNLIDSLVSAKIKDLNNSQIFRPNGSNHNSKIEYLIEDEIEYQAKQNDIKIDASFKSLLTKQAIFYLDSNMEYKDFNTQLIDKLRNFVGGYIMSGKAYAQSITPPKSKLDRSCFLHICNPTKRIVDE